MKKKLPTLDPIANALPGFGFSGPADQVLAEPRDEDPALTLAATSAELRSFFTGRDPVAFLARTGLHLLLQLGNDPSSDSGEGLQQPGAELLQSIALTLPRGPSVPTSPRNMVRAWDLAERNIHAYAGSTPWPGPDGGAAERISRQARIQTLYYRNIFSSEDAQAVVPALLSHMDQASLDRLGYRLSDVARALFRFLELIPERIDRFRSVPTGFHDGKVDPNALDSLLASSALCRRAWRFVDQKRTDHQYRSWAAFQLSELAWGAVLTFTRTELEGLFGRALTGALFSASIGFGELVDGGGGGLYLDSPIRRKPFIRLSAEACFYIAFYHASANKLTADERRFAIFDVDKRVEPTSDMPARWASLLQHCVVRHDWLHIDLEPFLTQTHARWDRYVAALSMVESDKGILGGTPVIAGTRIPVHDVAASAAAGLPTSRIREAYPTLGDSQIELASLYARANPLQGRPPGRRMLGDDRVISRRVVERRQPTA